jgi:PPOX class probable F420-dependent enzyme
VHLGPGSGKLRKAPYRERQHDQKGAFAMSATIEGKAEDLLKGKNFAHVATLRADGSVQTAPVWVDLQDGKPVVNSAEGRAWPRNLARDPRVTLTVQNMENPYEYVEVRGRVAERTHDGADAHIDSLAKKYLGKDEYPYRQPGEQRVIIRVDPESVHVMGG